MEDEPLEQNRMDLLRSLESRNTMQRKDKRLRCIKCGRGGHDSATCLNRAQSSKFCHVCCKFVDAEHDSFTCKDRVAVCSSCGMFGHRAGECSTTKA